jgi:hypothetical protein
MRDFEDQIVGLETFVILLSPSDNFWNRTWNCLPDICAVSTDGNRNGLCELFSKDATHVMQSGWSGLKFCVILQPFLFLSSFKTTGMP